MRRDLYDEQGYYLVHIGFELEADGVPESRREVMRRSRRGFNLINPETNNRIKMKTVDAVCFAWAFTRYSVDYVDQQEEARTATEACTTHDCVPAEHGRNRSHQQQSPPRLFFCP